jgi:putative SOS response-associated peptidase YedK
MCGRYSQDSDLNDVRLILKVEQLELFRDWTPTYNIGPSYAPGAEQLIVVRTRAGKRALRLARWWLIPAFWQKPLKALPTAFNARAEEIDKKSLWQAAFRSSRCLVPATGWREFTGGRGHKQPYHFQLERHLFAFAGLWSTWTSPQGEVIDSFAIITTEPSSAAARIHDRMPLVLSDSEHARWLDPSIDPSSVLRLAQEQSLSRPLDIYPSDPIANSGQYEGPQAIARVPNAPAVPVQGELFAATGAKKP